MILEIDAGNTFIKWRILGASDQIVDRGQLLTSELVDKCPAGWTQKFSSVRIASVAGEQINSLLTTHLRSVDSIAFAKTQPCSSGVTNSYIDPSRMGVDRWLVMVAAYHDAKGACCVVDCGSAITVDYVAADGRHEGGYIIPGLHLMQRGLLSNTAEIIVDRSVERFETDPGKHTSAAVVHGINYMFEALVEKIARELRDEGLGRALYITGGDGELFSRLADCGDYVPDLVLDGLKLELA